MSAPASTATATPNGDGTGGDIPAAGNQFTPIESQADLDKIIGERVKRERDKYPDYAELKKLKADRDAEIERSKSDIDKAMDRVTAAEAEVATVPAKVADALRTHLVALHEINDEDAELFLTAQEPALLLKQVERLTGRQANTKKPPAVVPREGTTTPTVDSDERRAARELFGGGNT